MTPSMSSVRRTRIAEIEAMLASGVTSTTVDGQSASFDLESLRRELRRLKELEGIQRPRQKVTNIFLG